MKLIYLFILGFFLPTFCFAQESLLQNIKEKEDLRQFSVDDFTSYLSHPSPWIRERAALAIGRIQSEDSISLLSASLESEEEPRVLESLIFAAGQLNNETLIAALLPHLQQYQPRLRVLACEALGKTKNASQGEKWSESTLGKALILALKDLNPEVRASAALAFFRQKATSAALELIPLLSDPSAEVRWRTVYSLMQLKSKRLEVQNSLLKATEDENEYVRLFATRALTQFVPEPVVTKRLLRLLQDENIFVALNALYGFRKKTEYLPEEALLDLLKHPSFHLRAQAIELLAEQKNSKALPHLISLLQDPYITVRQQALIGLTTLAPSLGASFFEEFLNAKEYRDRMALISALKFVPKERIKRWIPRLCKDKDARVRAHAFEQMLTKDSYDSLVLTGLKDKDLAVRGTIVYTLKDLLSQNFLSEKQKEVIFAALQETYEDSQEREYYEIRELILNIFRTEKNILKEMFHKGLADEFFSVRNEAYLGLKTEDDSLSAPTPSPSSLSPFLKNRLPLSPKIVLKTNRGEITIKLFSHQAPIHVANILSLVENKFYDQLIIHRVVPSFVIQGGDPLGNGWGDPGYTIRDEINRIPYLRGTLGMPKAGKDTGGCQLFITHIPTPHLDGRYTVFGQVVEGLSVVDQLEIGDKLLQVRLLKK